MGLIAKEVQLNDMIEKDPVKIISIRLTASDMAPRKKVFKTKKYLRARHRRGRLNCIETGFKPAHHPKYAPAHNYQE